MMPEDRDREMASVLAVLAVVGWLLVVWFMPAA